MDEIIKVITDYIDNDNAELCPQGSTSETCKHNSSCKECWETYGRYKEKELINSCYGTMLKYILK